MIPTPNNLLMAAKIESNATHRDWWLAIISLTPILPWFIFIPRLIKKLTLKFNTKWFWLYNPKSHNRRIKERYGIELV